MLCLHLIDQVSYKLSDIKILCYGTVLKLSNTKRARERGDAIRALAELGWGLNDEYSLMQVEKGISDTNPFVKASSIISFMKYCWY